MSKTYTFLLNPTVVVRISTDALLPPEVVAQQALVEHLRTLRTTTLAVVEAACHRAWPHGCDDLPPTENPRTRRP
jgi:hypothetical protein